MLRIFLPDKNSVVLTDTLHVFSWYKGNPVTLTAKPTCPPIELDKYLDFLLKKKSNDIHFWLNHYSALKILANSFDKDVLEHEAFKKVASFVSEFEAEGINAGFVTFNSALSWLESYKLDSRKFIEILEKKVINGVTLYNATEKSLFTNPDFYEALPPSFFKIIKAVLAIPEAEGAILSMEF